MSEDDKFEPSQLMSIKAIVETLGLDQVYAWTGKHDEDAFFVSIATRLIREGLQQLFEGKHDRALGFGPERVRGWVK